MTGAIGAGAAGAGVGSGGAAGSTGAATTFLARGAAFLTGFFTAFFGAAFLTGFLTAFLGAAFLVVARSNGEARFSKRSSVLFTVSSFGLGDDWLKHERTGKHDSSK